VGRGRGGGGGGTLLSPRDNEDGWPKEKFLIN